MIRNWWARRRDRRPMDCGQVAAVLQHYLDGQLDARAVLRIEQHLAACRRCGIEVETYERIKAVLASRREELSAEAVARLTEFGERLVRGDDPQLDSPPR